MKMKTCTKQAQTFCYLKVYGKIINSLVKKGNKNWSQYHFQDLESSDKQILCLDRKKKNNEEMTSVYLIHI